MKNITVYYILMDSNGIYKVLPYDFLGSLKSFSTLRGKINFIKEIYFFKSNAIRKANILNKEKYHLY